MNGFPDAANEAVSGTPAFSNQARNDEEGVMSGIVTNGDLARDDWHDHRKSQRDEPTPTDAASDGRRAAIMEKRTLTDIEVATRLGVSRFTVRSWRLKGIGPRFLKLGRAVRYRPEDVDEYVRQALIEPQTR